jgi:hypothetical protein
MATSVATLSADIEKLNVQALALREKVSADVKRAEDLRIEQDRIADGIAAGVVKENAIIRNKEEIAVVEARLAGNRRALQPLEQRMRQLTDERVAVETAARRQARERELAELRQKGEALSHVIKQKLLQIMTEDLPRFDAVRTSLALEFRDLNGAAEASRLFASLFDHSTHPKMNTEYWHIAELRRAGWRPFWRVVPGHRESGLHEPAQPLPAVELPIVSLDPPER